MFVLSTPATRVRSVTKVRLSGLMRLMRPSVAKQAAALSQRAFEQDRSDLEGHPRWRA
jgi:hypothetical protein